jgi:NAD(P)-dependent dehydrogenase (short-subunit alcohol dehydrogenase family)
MPFPAPTFDYPADGSVMPVQRFVWQPEPIARAADDAGKLLGKHVMILGGTDDAAQQLNATLTRLGAIVLRVPKDELNPVMHARLDGIIDLNLSEMFQPALKGAWRQPLRQTVSMLKAVYADWLSVSDTTRIFYMAVTCMDGRMGYCETPYQPLGGIWAGLAKTIPREIPNCNVKVLDLSPTDYARLDEFVAAELYHWGLCEIGYCQGVRYQLAPRLAAPDAPATPLSERDVVLISGGGRGIGFALAQALCRNYECRVVVTGRSQAPAGSEPWIALNATQLKAFRNDLLKNLAPGASIAEVRRDVDRMARQIELHRHLTESGDAGLQIEYRACDFTDGQQVRRLIDSFGPELTGIVHNAGVDTPQRLSGKSLDNFVETIAPKIDGFLNIHEALNGRPLRFLCNVGSLTGRMGGMVGQLDYAASNDGLARLGLWAARNASYTVKTLCWPTWERLGMIANYDATLRYMSALNIDEGLYHWQNELTTGGSGEVTFIGHFGKALSPIQAHGFPMSSQMPQYERLASNRFYLGQPLEFRPWRYLRSRNRIHANSSPCMSEFSWRGRPAMPIGVLLDFAISLGDWVVPEGYPDLQLEEIRDLRVHLPQLAEAASKGEFEKEASGSWDGTRWTLAVRMATDLAPSLHPIAEMKLVFGPLRNAQFHNLHSTGEEILETTGSSIAGMRWSGGLFRFANWVRGDDGWIGKTNSCQPSDLWTTPLCPAAMTPVSHLENILRLALLQQNDPAPAETIAIAHIRFFGDPSHSVSIRRGSKPGEWWVMDNSGLATMCVEGISCQAATPHGILAGYRTQLAAEASS